MDYVILKPNYIDVNYALYILSVKKYEVNRTILGQSDIWTRPSPWGQLEIYEISVMPKFWKVGNFAIICYVNDKWANPENLGVFWANVDEVRHPQSWRGHIR